MDAPRFGSATSVGGDLHDAVARAVDEVGAALEGAVPDVAFLFVTPQYAGGVAEAGEQLSRRLGPRHVLGCTALGVLHDTGEHERGAALSLLAGTLPGARISAFDLRHDQLLTMSGPEPLRAVVGMPAAARPLFVLLADPFTLEGDLLLARLGDAYEGAPAVGGLASGGTRPGSHQLFLDGEVTHFGAVGLAISGIPVRTVVSQGCRPVGRRFVVTRAESNKVFALSGRPALPAIQDAVAELSEDDRELARTSLLIGRVAHEARDDFGRGDFVIRNLMGVLPEEDAIVVGDRVRVGQTLQLQLRDGETAAEDLDIVLREAALGSRANGVLLFSCAGRGEPLFGERDHDVHAVRRHLGDAPLAGFFCNGEIGCVGSRNFVHGFTASMAIF